MKKIKKIGHEYGVHKIGNQYLVSRTIKMFDKWEDAQNAVVELVKGHRTEEEVTNGQMKDVN